MTELDRAKASLRTVLRKGKAAQDADSKLYYKLCADGWRKTIKRLKEESRREMVDTTPDL